MTRSYSVSNKTAAILVAAGATLATTIVAQACSCRQQSYEQTIAAADIVFRGTPTEFAIEGENAMQLATTFHIGEVLKGDIAGELVIHTRTISTACGVDFRTLPDPQIVAAYRDDAGRWTTDKCTMFNLKKR